MSAGGTVPQGADARRALAHIRGRTRQAAFTFASQLWDMSEERWAAALAEIRNAGHEIYWTYGTVADDPTVSGGWRITEPRADGAVEAPRPRESSALASTARHLKDVRDVRIVASARCERCDGEGQVYDPEDFGWSALVEVSPPEDETSRRGLERRIRARVDELGLDREPPAEGACPHCLGHGRTEVVLSPGEYRQLTTSAHSAARPPERRSALAEVLAKPRRILALPDTERREVVQKASAQQLVAVLQAAAREIRSDQEHLLAERRRLVELRCLTLTAHDQLGEPPRSNDPTRDVGVERH